MSSLGTLDVLSNQWLQDFVPGFSPGKKHCQLKQFGFTLVRSNFRFKKTVSLFPGKLLWAISPFRLVNQAEQVLIYRNAERLNIQLFVQLRCRTTGRVLPMFFREHLQETSAVDCTNHQFFLKAIHWYMDLSENNYTQFKRIITCHNCYIVFLLKYTIGIICIEPVQT